MKIHSNVITWHDIVKATNGVPGVLCNQSEGRSRSHARRFDLYLSSNGTPDQHGTPRRHKTNSGQTGAGHAFAASYADWGHVLAALFALDPDMVAGSYKGADDFHAQTKGQFRVVVSA